jgi:hypothetical protein
MRNIFLSLIALVATIDVCALLYAAEKVQQEQNAGVVITREASSSPSYNFLNFTNNNKYDVVITYTVDGNMSTKISVKAGESKKTISAYKNSAVIKTSVEPLLKNGDTKSKPDKKRNQK